MSILTEGEIRDAMVKAYRIPVTGNDWEAQRKMNMSRAIESALLQKLAGMELPGTVELSSSQDERAIYGYTATQLHQAYAQGAASQLSAEPEAWQTFDGEGGYEYRSYEDNEAYAEEWDKRNPSHKGWVERLYTIKGSK